MVLKSIGVLVLLFCMCSVLGTCVRYANSPAMEQKIIGVKVNDERSRKKLKRSRDSDDDTTEEEKYLRKLARKQSMRRQLMIEEVERASF